MPDEKRIHEMQQQFNELRQAIAGDIAERLEASEQRLREGLSNEVAARFEASERRLSESLSQVVARQLETAPQHLEGRMQVHSEELKDLVTKAAEGYGGTLEAIERELKDFRSEWRSKAGDTDRVLANHAGRIVAIEKTLSSS